MSLISGEMAYTAATAATYERDRHGQHLWSAEHEYVRRWLTCMPRGLRLLDVPFGTGRFVELYKLHQAAVTGIDVSEPMLIEAQRRLTNARFAANIKQGNVCQLSFDNDEFDAVLSWRLAHLLDVETLSVAIHEMTRVGQTLVLEVYGGLGVENTPKATASRYAQARRKVRSLLLGRPKRSMQGKDVNSSDKSPWSHIRAFYHSHDTIVRLCKEASLRINELTILGECYDATCGMSESVARVYILSRSKCD